MKKRIKALIFPVVLIAGLGVFLFTGRTGASDAAYTYEGEPEIVAATFSSAWCSSCKVLEPRLSKVIPAFADQPVKFVKLDFTLGQREQIEEQARAEGLGDVYPRFKGATGFTLLVDRETGEIVDMLTMKHSQAAMRAAIAQSIAVASQNNES